jgi:hypothetical protein
MHAYPGGFLRCFTFQLPVVCFLHTSVQFHTCTTTQERCVPDLSGDIAVLPGDTGQTTSLVGNIG